MTRHAAFLRGVNLGKRTVRSAALVTAFEAMGFGGVKTLLASGNVLFDAAPVPDLGARIEAGLGRHFGFDIGVVLRAHAALAEMLRLAPFRDLPAEADATRYVALLREPVGRTLALPCGIPGDFDILSTTDHEIYAVAWRMPSGRHGEGLDTLGKRLPKGTLMTMRNWNTIVKAAG